MGLFHVARHSEWHIATKPKIRADEWEVVRWRDQVAYIHQNPVRARKRGENDDLVARVVAPRLITRIRNKGAAIGIDLQWPSTILL